MGKHPNVGVNCEFILGNYRLFNILNSYIMYVSDHRKLNCNKQYKAKIIYIK